MKDKFSSQPEPHDGERRLQQDGPNFRGGHVRSFDQRHRDQLRRVGLETQAEGRRAVGLLRADRVGRDQGQRGLLQRSGENTQDNLVSYLMLSLTALTLAFMSTVLSVP